MRSAGASAHRAEQLGGEQFARDVLQWLDDHEPSYRATVRITLIDAANASHRSVYVNASDPIDAVRVGMRDATATGGRHLVEVFPAWNRDVNSDEQLLQCVASWDAEAGQLTVFDEEAISP